MKTLTRLLIFLFGFGFLQAQEPAPDLETQLATAFSQLDYSTLETGIHIDRIPAYLTISNYDGTWPADSLQVNWLTMRFLYGMLTYSQVGPPKLAPLDSLMNSQWEDLQDQDTTVMGGMWIGYDRFKTWALDSNLIWFDSTSFHRVPGSVSPFEQTEVFAFSPSDPIRYGLTQTLLLDSAWLLTNRPAWEVLELDADDGLGWRPVLPGQALTLTYSEAGEKRLQVRMPLASGDTLLSASRWDIRDEPQLTSSVIRGFHKNPDETLTLGAPTNWKIWVKETNCGNDSWKQVDATLPEGLTAYIFYNQDCEIPALRKPLFLVNGFDPARSHGWEFVLGEDGLLEDQYEDESGKKLSDHLHDEKFDIIYVTFSDATGDIRTNAAWLRQLIEVVNGLKATAGSTEKNVVIGASMGGLISKWALLSMQNENVDHETELFVTVDSPLRGANIPLGMQAMLKDVANTKVFGKVLKDQVPVLKFNLETLESKGARQMLYYNWMTVGCTYCNGANLDDEHDEFYQEFQALGFLNIPHIGLSNGAINGEGNTIQPSMNLLTELQAQDLIQKYLENCDPLPIQGIANFIMELKVWAAPGYSGWINLWVGNKSGVVFTKRTQTTVLSIPWVSWSVYTAKDITSWDHSPGGLRSFNGVDENGNEKQDFPWTRKSFCFIPTVSSLDIAGADPFYTGYNLQDVEGNVVDGNTTLRSYVGAVEASPGQFWQQQTNQEHVTFDKHTANFTKSLLKTTRIPESSNPLVNRIFNFGKAEAYSVNPEVATPLNTRNVIDYDLSIQTNGQLWINREDRIGFTDMTVNPVNANNEIYDVHVKPGFCDGSDVIVDVIEGGLIRIGQDGTGHQGQLFMHDHTSLLVKGSGTVLLENGYDNNIILQRGDMIIYSGGTVDASWGSRILVQDGSTLTVKAGGKLYMKQYSSLEVEKGGKLVLEPGAEIQLWDGQSPEGQATIHIHKGGELVWQGDIQFSGNGFFQFDQGNIFTVSTAWNLSGMGAETRMVRLNDKAVVNVPYADMSLSDGAVEFAHGSSLEHSHGETRLEKVTCYGNSFQSGFGIIDEYPEKVMIGNCRFDNLEFGYQVAEFHGPSSEFIVQNSTFDGCMNGFAASPAGWITVDQSLFKDCVTALYFREVKYAYINDCIIQGNNSNQDIGVYLEDVPVFRMHGGLIDGLDDGIMSLQGFQSNVFLYSQATVSNCNRGIYMQKGGVNSQGLDYGLVLLDCANLLNNGEGVIGEDVLLQVDAQGNAAQHPNQAVTPNTFVNGPNPLTTDDIFQICYDERDADPVLARQNVWGNGTPDPATDFDNHDLGSAPNGCTFTFNKVDNVVTDPVAQFVIDCPIPPRAPGFVDNGGLTQPPIFGSTETCLLGGAASIPAHDAWARGLERFFAEDLDASSTWLDPVAGVSESVRDTASLSCRHYIDVARVLVDAIDRVRNQVPARTHSGADGNAGLDWDGDMSGTIQASIELFPNPAVDVLDIRFGEGAAGRFRIVNGMGLVMHDAGISNAIRLDLYSWPEGMYEVQAMDPGGRVVTNERFMVVK